MKTALVVLRSRVKCFRARIDEEAVAVHPGERHSTLRMVRGPWEFASPKDWYERPCSVVGLKVADREVTVPTPSSLLNELVRREQCLLEEGKLQVDEIEQAGCHVPKAATNVVTVDSVSAVLDRCGTSTLARSNLRQCWPLSSAT